MEIKEILDPKKLLLAIGTMVKQRRPEQWIN
jgi:hypothetical protein